jgi:hypothetical protein
LGALDIVSDPELVTTVTTLPNLLQKLPAKAERNMTVNGNENIVAAPGAVALRDISIGKIEVNGHVHENSKNQSPEFAGAEANAAVVEKAKDAV